jgi:hypothetical protein
VKRVVAHLIAGAFGVACAYLIGAQVRGDNTGSEPGRDTATGLAIVGAAAAVKWALAEIDREEAELTSVPA